MNQNIPEEPLAKKRKRDDDMVECVTGLGLHLSKEFHLSEELKAPEQYQYRGLVHDEHHFKRVNDAYLRHGQQRAGLAAENDSSWPQSDDEKRQYVKKLFDAITNTSDFHEARKARAKIDAHDAAARGKAPSASERVLADHNKSAVDRLEAVLHYKMSNLEVELVSWKILVRLRISGLESTEVDTMIVQEAAMACQQGHTMRALWAGERTNSQWDVFEKFEDRWNAICENMTVSGTKTPVTEQLGCYITADTFVLSGLQDDASFSHSG